MAEIRKVEKSQIDLNDMMRISQDAIMSRLNCHNVGQILEFDENTQTCSVQIMQLKQFANDFFEPAPITNVPLIIYGGGNGYITYPSPVGSYCLLFFMDRNIDAFLRTGELYAPETTRMHDFTDCIALTTFSTLNNPIQDYDPDAVSIIYQKLVNEVLYNAVIKNYGNSIQLKVSNELNTSQIVVNDLINIQNTAQNLAVLMQSFITACENITITSNAVSTASKQTFENLKTQFAELLQ